MLPDIDTHEIRVSLTLEQRLKQLRDLRASKVFDIAREH